MTRVKKQHVLEAVDVLDGDTVSDMARANIIEGIEAMFAPYGDTMPVEFAEHGAVVSLALHLALKRGVMCAYAEAGALAETAN